MDSQEIALKRLIALALIPSLALGTTVYPDEYGFPSLIVLETRQTQSVEHCDQVRERGSNNSPYRCRLYEPFRSLSPRERCRPGGRGTSSRHDLRVIADRRPGFPA